MPLADHHRIIIVGAGIVGTTLAWYLSHAFSGKIVLLDSQEAGQGVTQHAFAWLNVSYGRPDGYSQLRQQALEEWRRLDALTEGRLNLQWCGAISWQDNATQTQQFIDSQRKGGFNIRPLTRAQLLALEPQLASPPSLAAFCQDEGYVDPLQVTQTLLELAINRGIEYRPHTTVYAVEQTRGKVSGVVTDKGSLSADQVVIAAGTGAIDLLKTLNIVAPLSASPSIIARLRQPMSAQGEAPLLRHIISNPQMEVRPAGEGQILCAEDYISASEQHNARHIAEDALTVIKQAFGYYGELTVEKAAVGMRPMPADEMPIVGHITHHDGLYLISMHAAITLAPLLCQLATAEILDGIRHPTLAPYRLSRFA